MFGDGSRIRKVAVVENGVAMLHKALVEMALGLPNVLFAAFFAFNEIDKVFAFTVQGFMYVHVYFFFFFMKIVFIFSCMFRDFPGCSGMLRVPDFMISTPLLYITCSFSLLGSSSAVPTV